MTRGRVRVEHGRKRVRAYLGGELAADTTSPLLVWEVPYYPAYYIPAGDIQADLVPTGNNADIDARWRILDVPLLCGEPLVQRSQRVNRN